MAYETARRITEYLRDRVDDGLRTVVVIEQDGWEIHYLREDLRAEYTEETYDEVVDFFRLERPFLATAVASRPIGEHRATVHCHENAFVLQFPVKDAESVLVSLTPDTGRDLLEFIEECRRIVDGE